MYCTTLLLSGRGERENFMILGTSLNLNVCNTKQNNCVLIKKPGHRLPRPK